MSIRIHGKLGTLPGDYFAVKYLRNEPKVNQFIRIRPWGKRYRWDNWTPAIVNEVNDWPDGRFFRMSKA